MDDLNDVAVFVAVVDAGSFTRAAERLKVSRPVVSKQVSRLEDSLGVRLLNRTTRRLSLTEAGRIFHAQTSRGLEDIAEARAEVSRLQQQPRGVLRINVPMSFGILHIAPLLPAFMQQYPELTVEMDLNDRKLDVIEEGFDASVRISDLPDSTLVARRLAPCRHVIVAAPAYLERHGIPDRPEDLLEHEVLSYSLQQSAQAWHFLDSGGQPTQVAVAGRLQVNNSLALREALLAGMGIARTPTFLVGDDLRRGRLTTVLDTCRSLELSIYIVYPQRRYLSPKVRAFADFLAAKIKDPPYWDQPSSP
ncbi:MAG: LysR substrate-binding domain-containing protein [Haliea sp.]|uniref:LysR family transcriptional regulator n=1 Tax=Haliea sp. TaxID=1932666 RepID=UPI0032EF4DFA